VQNDKRRPSSRNEESHEEAHYNKNDEKNSKAYSYSNINIMANGSFTATSATLYVSGTHALSNCNITASRSPCSGIDW
jgi:hypothetical protein